MIEGGHGKIAAPEQSDTHATEICQDRVAAAFSTLKALVRVTPHTVSGSNCFRFSDDILKSYLEDRYRGSYISAHVLLNLSNELGKRDKMRGLQQV